MARHTVNFGTLTIANGQTNSNVISAKAVMGHVVSYIIHAPATLTNEVQVVVGPDKDMAASALTALYVAGDEVSIPASRSVEVPAAAFKSLAVRSAGAEGGARAFRVTAQVEM